MNQQTRRSFLKSTAVTAAETGHLVFATLHTNSAAQSIDRIVDVFPDNQQIQIRLQLSNVLEGIISLRLVPALSGGRVPVAEVLRFLAYHDFCGDYHHAVVSFRDPAKEVRDGRCSDCSVCAIKCPNGVHVQDRLIRAQSLLA